VIFLTAQEIAWQISDFFQKKGPGHGDRTNPVESAQRGETEHDCDGPQLLLPLHKHIAPIAVKLALVSESICHSLALGSNRHPFDAFTQTEGISFWIRDALWA
jgi:hypothetical protein